MLKGMELLTVCIPFFTVILTDLCAILLNICNQFLCLLGDLPRCFREKIKIKSPQRIPVLFQIIGVEIHRPL